MDPLIQLFFTFRKKKKLKNQVFFIPFFEIRNVELNVYKRVLYDIQFHVYMQNS